MRDRYLYGKYSVKTNGTFVYREWEKNEIESLHVQNLKIYYRWIKENIKTLVENMKEYSHGIGMSNNFFQRTKNW